VLVLALRLLLAAVFAVAAVAKLRDREGTASTLGEFGVPARLRTTGALALPLAELVAAGLLIALPTARVGALLALALLLVFVAAVSRALARGERPDCNCFGGVHSAPVSRLTLVRNVTLAAVAAAVAVAGPGESLAALDGGTVLAVAAALAGALLLGLTWFSWELFQQNGRLLLRVRALEEATTPGAAAGSRLPGPPEAVRGLPAGELAPDLVMATADGAPRSILELAGAAPAPLALVFSDPACGGCVELTKRLPALREALDGVLEPILVTREAGPHAEAAAAAGLPVLVQEDREAIVAFAIGAVPAAVLLDASGRIASAPAIGDVAVEELLLGARPAPDFLEVVNVAGGV